jgi:hypothetical protein
MVVQVRCAGSSGGEGTIEGGKPRCQQVFNWYYKFLKWTTVVKLKSPAKYLFSLVIVASVAGAGLLAHACHFAPLWLFSVS